MRWAFILILVSMLILSGCGKTGILECDYNPGKIKGDPVKNCAGVVYYNSAENQCMVKGAGRGEVCPESAFKVDTTALLDDCYESAQVEGDREYCKYRVGEKTVSDALVLCQETCENLE